MKITHIKNKLEQMGVSLDGIVMGDFDRIGDVTARRERNSNDINYKKYGWTFRSNYERGILFYYLIRQYNLSSFIEIGFGRGYVTLCVAKAFHDAGIKGRIVTIDPNFDERFLNGLKQHFPKEWFDCIEFVKATSQQALPQINETFDLAYIDGDHSYQGTKSDWEMIKDKFNKIVVFDDYHLPTKNDPGIQCRHAIDEIDEASVGCHEKELIRMDRRMFFDDRQFADDQVDYGQAILTKSGVSRDDW